VFKNKVTSVVLNQPRIESLWCVYLSELEQVLTGASGSCCMNQKSSNLHEEKTTSCVLGKGAAAF